MARGLTDIRKVLSRFNENPSEPTTQKQDVTYAYYVFFGRNPNQKDYDEKCNRPLTGVFQSLIISDEFSRKLDDSITYPDNFISASSSEHASFYTWIEATFGAKSEKRDLSDAATRMANLADIATGILRSETPLRTHLANYDEAMVRLRKLAAYHIPFHFLSDERRRKDLFGNIADDVLAHFFEEDFSTCLQVAVINNNKFVETVFEARRKILLRGNDADAKFRVILDDAHSFLESLKKNDSLSPGDLSVVNALQNSITDSTYNKRPTIFRLRFAPTGAGIAAELFHPEASGSFPPTYLAEIGDDPGRFAADISLPSNVLRMDETLSRFSVLFQDIGQTPDKKLLFFRLGDDDSEFRLMLLEGVLQVIDNEAAVPPKVEKVLQDDGALVFAIEEKPGIRPYRIVLDGKTLDPVVVSPEGYDLHQIDANLPSSGQTRFKIYIFDAAGLKGHANLFNLDGQLAWSDDVDFSDIPVALLKQEAVFNPDTFEIDVHYVELRSPDMAFSIELALETAAPQDGGERESKIVSSSRKNTPAAPENLLFSLFSAPRYSLPVTADFLGNTEKTALVSIFGSSEQPILMSLPLKIAVRELDQAFEYSLVNKNTSAAQKLLILAATAKFHFWIAERIHDYRLDLRNDERYAVVVKYLLEAGRDQNKQLEDLLNSIWVEEIGSPKFFHSVLRDTFHLSHEAEQGFESGVFPSTPLKEQALDGLIVEKNHFESHPDKANASLKLLRKFERTGILANQLASLGTRHPGNRVILYERARYEYRQSFQSAAADFARSAIAKRKDYREPQLLLQQIESRELSSLKTFALKTNLEGLKLHSPSASVSVDIGRSSLPLMLRHLPTKAALLANHNELKKITEDRDRIIGKSPGPAPNYSVVFAANTYEATKAFHDAFIALNSNCKAVMQTQSKWINESAFVGDWVFVFHAKYKITEENLVSVFAEKGPQTGMVVIHTGKHVDQGLELEQIGFLARSQDVADLPRCIANDAANLLRQRVRSANVYVKAEK